MTPLKVFLAQLVFVMLVNIQTINVSHSQHLNASLTSVLLGMLGFWLTAVIAEVRTKGVFSATWWAFIVAGAIAAPLSIWIHKIVG